MLMRDFGFESRNVRALTDAQATKAALLGDWERAVLTDDDLARLLAKLPDAVHLAALWDTCHAGTMQDTASPSYRRRSSTCRAGRWCAAGL